MSLALKKLELLTLEMRDMKPTEASGIATEFEGGHQKVKAGEYIAKPKRTRRKSRKSRTSNINNEDFEPVSLGETKAVVQNDAEQRASNPAAGKTKEKKKMTTTWRRSRRSKGTPLHAGSQEAGEQASQKDMGILMVLHGRGQNVQETMV